MHFFLIPESEFYLGGMKNITKLSKHYGVRDWTHVISRIVNVFLINEIVFKYLRIHLLKMALKKYFKHFSNKDVVFLRCIEFYINLEKELSV